MKKHKLNDLGLKNLWCRIIQKIKAQKSSIKIPSAIVIIVLIIIVLAGASVVLYKQGKIPSLVGNIFTSVAHKSEAFIMSISEIAYKTIWEKKFQMEELKQEVELSKIKEERAKKQAQEETGKRVEAETAKGEAEQKAKKETTQRVKEEARRAQEELERKIAEQKLSEKEAEEHRLNADSDKDGLTLREEQKLGTSDLDRDSDGDGINDGEDAHPASSGRNLAQNFEWQYEGTLWSYTLSIPDDWYQYYKNKPRSPHGTEYVTSDDKFIKAIAKKIKETAEKEGYHMSSFIVSFIQGLPYVADYYTTFNEYPKYPIETIIDRNGDCEDTSYLFASIVEATGIGTALIEFHNHVGVGIKTVHSQSGYYYSIGDERYYYYETTGKDWEVGELPKDYLYEKAKITRAWDGKVVHLSPKYQKHPCEYVSEYNLYWNGENLYHNNSCTQLVVKGCYKSKTYSGKFYKSGSAWYYDSECKQLYKSMTCDYPSSYAYTCAYESSYNVKKNTCDYYKTSQYLSSMAESCYEELAQCRKNINEYQSKLNEYNKCKDRKEY